VQDLAEAHLLAFEALDERPRMIYNLGNGQGFTVRQVVESARRVTGQPIPVEELPRRPGDPAVLIASAAKIESELGWKPKFPQLDDIMRSAWQWHQRRYQPASA
jgi:UDP-glucose 4-epimerase